MSFQTLQGEACNKRAIMFGNGTNENLEQRNFIIFKQLKFLEDILCILLLNMMIEIEEESFISYCQMI